MTPIQTIQVKPMNLKNQRMNEDGDLRLEFYDGYFKYIGDFYADEPKDRDDHSLGWEMVYNRFDIVVNKTCISGFEKSWAHQYEHWSVYIFINGIGDEIKLFFKSEKDANEVMDKLIEYTFS
jgi:hypothetical protein